MTALASMNMPEYAGVFRRACAFRYRSFSLNGTASSTPARSCVPVLTTAVNWPLLSIAAVYVASFAYASFASDMTRSPTAGILPGKSSPPSIALRAASQIVRRQPQQQVFRRSGNR